MNWNRIKAHSVYYPTLAWNVLLGRVLKVRNWWDVIDENVFLGALPMRADVSVLADLGVRAIVNTCEEAEGPVDLYAQDDMQQLWIPTVDYTQPSFGDVERAVEFIDKHIASGNKVYVHCKAGRARSGTIAICWLIKNRQVTATQAQAALTLARPHVNQRLTTRPVVQQFESKYLLRQPLG